MIIIIVVIVIIIVIINKPHNSFKGNDQIPR